VSELDLGEGGAPSRSEAAVASDRLTSWKEVAAYLGREVRTVQRWERREGLPVRRHHHERSGTIYAFRSEIDQWLESRRRGADRLAAPAGSPERKPRERRWPLVVVALLAAAGSASLGVRPRSAPAPAASERSPSGSAPALEAWRRGRYLLSRDTERGYLESARAFAEAVRLDPGFAEAHVGLADAYLMLGRHGYRPPVETMPLARESALEAQRLDAAAPGLQAVLAGLLFYWDWDFEAAEAAYRRAIAEDPGSARSHHGLAHFLSAMGRHDEALAESRRARILEPLSVAIHSDAAWFYYRARRYEEALAESRRALELEPGFGSALLCAVSILADRGEPAAAVAELRGAARAEGGDELLALLEGTDPGAALERFRRWRLERLLHAEGYVSPYYLASAHASLGEVDAAFAWLEKAYAARDRAVLLLNVNPGFDPLRGDPRFAELLARVGLAPLS